MLAGSMLSPCLTMQTGWLAGCAGYTGWLCWQFRVAILSMLADYAAMLARLDG
jgi:hypothetical protein